MSRIVLSLLGGFHVVLAGRPVTAFESDRVRALLAYLAVEADRPHSRAELASLLWPDHPEDTARTNLRHVLRKLREAIQDDLSSPPCLLATHQTLQLNPASDIVVDVAAFNRRIAACEAHAREHDRLHPCPSCAQELTQAMALYRGPFLAGFSLAKSAPFEEWARTTQERLHRAALEALYHLTAYHEANGDYASAARFASWQVKLEPWREDAHAQWMRALALSGQREAALLQYETCCRVLEQELGIGPSDSLRRLAERIRAGQLSRDPAASSGEERGSTGESEHVRSQTGLPTPNNLPAQTTAFVGREREMSEIVSQLVQPTVRLMTLVGPGGMGKTRLALEAAQARTDAFPDGAWFVSLAALASAAAIAPSIATALGLSARGDSTQAVLQFLRNKRLLLILDNFEHLLSDSETPSWGRRTSRTEQTRGVDLVAEILSVAPNVQVIVTSRERLNLHAEHVYVVQGLDYPRPGDNTPAASSDWVAGMSASAVRLFVQSARRAQPDFRLDERNSPAVLRVCELVRGMPLGIELAAAWAASLTPDAIAAEIERSADFLAADWRDMPARQRSMRAVFDSSWKLLDAAEREALARLSVFRGGCTREAAQAVAGTSLHVLAKLVHKSLVRQTESGRLEVHELLRQFAAEQLARPDTSSERAEVEARHGAFYLAFAAAREQRLARNEPREATAEITAEIDNIRQAWGWASDHARVVELDRSAYALWQFYGFAGLAQEGAQMFQQAVERLRADNISLSKAGQRLLGRLLAFQASHLIALGKHAQALSIAQEAVSLSQASAGLDGEALGVMVQGQALRRNGDSLQAYALLRRAVDLARQHQRDGMSSELLADVEWRANGWLCSIALSPMLDYAAAQRYAEERLRVCTTLNKPHGQMVALTDLVDVAIAIGDLPAAQQRSEQVLDLARALQSRWGERVGCSERAHIASLQGDYTTACELTKRALAICRQTGEATEEATALTRLGRLNTLMGNHRLAREWFDQFFEALRAADTPAGEWLDGLLALSALEHDAGDDERALGLAKQALDLAEKKVSDPARQAVAWVRIGHATVGM